MILTMLILTLCRPRRAIILLLAMLTAGPALAQEPSVVLKSLDNLEKRLARLEGDLGKLRKAGPAPAAQASARPDTAVPRIAARFDSLLVRVNALESAGAEKPRDTAAAAPGASNSSANAEEITALVGEVKVLTALLRQGKATSQVAAAAAAPAAPPTKAAPSVSGSVATAPASAGGFELKGDIQIQGERKFTSQSGRENLDDFWGRLNFGGEYNQGDFQSKLNIRIFPEGFGFEPITGATFDTTGQGSLKLQTQSSTRLVVNHAWARYTVAGNKLKVGRFETVETQSENFGNYVDLSPAGKFMSRPAVHNALELSRPFGDFTGSALLGTNDRKLNRGFMRLFGKYAPSKQLQASAGYRANVFDRFKFKHEEILQRYDAGLLWGGLPAGWKVFGEAALLQVAGKPDQTPVLMGLQPATGKVLDLLAVEAEWLVDRKIAGKNKEWLLNVHARKVLGRLKLDAGCYSDLADPDGDSFGFGLRMTSNIK